MPGEEIGLGGVRPRSQFRLCSLLESSEGEILTSPDPSLAGIVIGMRAEGVCVCVYAYVCAHLYVSLCTACSQYYMYALTV